MYSEVDGDDNVVADHDRVNSDEPVSPIHSPSVADSSENKDSFDDNKDKTIA